MLRVMTEKEQILLNNFRTLKNSFHSQTSNRLIEDEIFTQNYLHADFNEKGEEVDMIGNSK